MASRHELQKTIDTQRETIEKYEKKLKDVIKAYKSVLVEKSALEESLQVLSSPKESDSADAAASVDTENLNDADNQSVPTGIESGKNDQRLAVLQKSLATISQEKIRIEAALTADRKNLLSRIEDLTEKLSKQELEAQKQRENLVQQVNEVRASLRQVQCERECEQSDHAAMIKELQLKLSHDRINADHQQQQVQNLGRELEETKTLVGAKDKVISDLNLEVEKAKGRLGEAQAKVNNIPTIHSLQTQLAQMKMASDEALAKEREKFQQLEEERRKLTGSSESRVCDLERKVTELSAMVGQLEQQHQKDVVTITELKQKLHQLDTENTSLAHISATYELTDLAGRISLVIESGESVGEIGRVFAQKLREKWPTASLYEAFCLESPDSDEIHNRCRLEFGKLKEEFERYKLKAQSVLKNKSTKEGSSKEVEELRAAVAGLQAKLEELRKEKNDSEAENGRITGDLRQSISEMRIRHQKLMEEMEGSRRQQIAELEAEMQKQRERTIALLADKDSEINCLRIMAGRAETADAWGGRLSASPVSELSLEKQRLKSIDLQSDSVASRSRPGRHSTENSDRFDLAQLSGIVARGASPTSIDSTAVDFSSGLPPPDPGSTGPTLFLSQELARKEQKLELISRAKRDLELSLREVQHSAVTKELQLFATVESLKETIRSLEARLGRQDCNRDGSQMEYLKNVLVSYMLCAKLESKQHMLKAIGAALKLTQREMEQIQSHNATWYNWLRAK